MRAAIAAVRQQEPTRVVVAAPVAAAFTCDELRAEGSEVVCVRTPEMLFAIGFWYAQFPPTADEEIQSLLERAWHPQAAERHRKPAPQV